MADANAAFPPPQTAYSAQQQAQGQGNSPTPLAPQNLTPTQRQAIVDQSAKLSSLQEQQSDTDSLLAALRQPQQHHSFLGGILPGVAGAGAELVRGNTQKQIGDARQAYFQGRFGDGGQPPPVDPNSMDFGYQQGAGGGSSAPQGLPPDAAAQADANIAGLRTSGAPGASGPAPGADPTAPTQDSLVAALLRQQDSGGTMSAVSPPWARGGGAPPRNYPPTDQDY